MKLTREHVARVATLARLELTEVELQTFCGQLDELLAHFNKLEQLDTTTVEPTSHVLPLSCPQRDDDVRPSLPRQTLLGQAPREQDGEYFVVPKVID